MAIPSHAARIRFGTELRRLRDRAGLHQRELAKNAFLSQAMLSDLERGKKKTKREHIVNLDAALNAEGSIVRLWESLTSYSGTPDWYQGFAVLERDALEIRDYHPLLMPGLLQTETYAAALIRIGQPSDTDAEVEEQVHARMERQAILDSSRPPVLIAVLDEAVLRRPIGGREIMRKQLEHLLRMSARPRITLQVIPLDTEFHPGLDGAFHLITVPERGQVLYTETRISGTPVDDQAGVDNYAKVFGELRGAALPEAPTRELISTAIGALE